MKKNLGNHYIDRKYKFVYNNGDSRWNKIILDNNCLFSDKKTGIYRTKITPDDLPEWYLNYWDGVRYNYINTKGVVDILYRPVLENHLFKDDCIFISYNKKIKVTETLKYSTTWFTVDEDEYDEILWDWEIINFLVYAKKYSGYDIEPIKDQIWNDKMLWLKDNEPDIFDGDRDVFESWFTDAENKMNKNA